MQAVIADIEYMRNNIRIVSLIIFVIFACQLSAQSDQQLRSPMTAGLFYDLGYDLYTAKDADFNAARRATTFFNAAIALDSRAGYVLDDIIEIAWQYPDENFSDAVLQSLYQYIDRKADLEVASKAVGYLLEKYNSREQREELLTKLNYEFGEKNIMFSSDLTAQLGFLKAETADPNEAYYYLMQSFNSNPFNRLAFAKLVEVVARTDYALPDTVYIQYFRSALRSNPLDLDSAISFGHYCDAIGAYEPAEAGYRYAVDLYNYLNAPKSADSSLYRPWMLSSYNSNNYRQCGKILEQVRKSGNFDVYIEALAAAAAMHNGDQKTLKSILAKIQTHSDSILEGKTKPSSGQLTDYAWFFNFASDSNVTDALTWATKAYDAEPNSPDAISFFAYALVRNGQTDLAAAMLKKLTADTQAASLVKAKIALIDDNNDLAIETLKGIIYASPGTLESQKAQKMLKELGSEYISAVDVGAFVTVLKNNFGQSYLGNFIDPAKMLSAELKIKASAFSYGSEITANLVITNNHTEPMIIGPDSLFKGHIRIDAGIGGDLTLQVPSLIEKTIRPSYSIAPASALLVPLRLDVGKVKCLLRCHPQAELNVGYTAYLDPKITADGKVQNSLNIPPAKTVVKRRKLALNTRYLQQRLDALRKGRQGQKAKSAQLFAGLIAEQQKFRKSSPAYRFVYAEPQLLSSALAKCLSEDDWVLKVRTLSAMENIKLDYRLLEAVSGQLSSEYWPVRLIALFMLDRNQDKGFLPVLSWTAENDSEVIVKEFASLLLAETDIRAGISGESETEKAVELPLTGQQ